VGLGASVSVAVAGIVVAGLGLLTMRSAFPPLPKPETPVVLARADRPLASAVLHPSSAVAPIVRPDVLTEDAPEAVEPSAPVRTARLHARAAEPLESPVKAETAALTPASQPIAAAPADAAPAAANQGKLCKAPAADDIASKVLQPGLILRYDTKFKSTPIDIPPPSPQQPEQERRLRLSALLADMLDN
jgi:hypothetical protein